MVQYNQHAWLPGTEMVEVYCLAWWSHFQYASQHHKCLLIVIIGWWTQVFTFHLLKYNAFAVRCANVINTAVENQHWRVSFHNELHIDHDKFLLGDYNQLTSSPEKNLSWSPYIEKLTIILSSDSLAVEFQIYCQRLLCVVNQGNLYVTCLKLS